jgi:hypothetical protein
MCELLVAGLPLKSDGVESQKVNDMLVRMAEVRRDAGQGSVGQQGRAGMLSIPSDDATGRHMAAPLNVSHCR